MRVAATFYFRDRCAGGIEDRLTLGGPRRRNGLVTRAKVERLKPEVAQLTDNAADSGCLLRQRILRGDRGRAETFTETIRIGCPVRRMY
jgi:hypothetical protein